MKGRLVVIDGADGTGKATQTKLLLKRLKKEGIPAWTYDFPQYRDNFFGKFIGECLAGKHGDFIGLDPYIASILYDCDRWESREKILGHLMKGEVVVLDRYVTANQIHQGGKIADPQERKKFLKWLDIMDFEVFKLPRPDLVLYLEVPFTQSRKLIEKKGGRLKNIALGRKKSDQAEGNPAHQIASRLYGRELIVGRGFRGVVCLDEAGKLLPPETIHERIWKKVEEVLH